MARPEEKSREIIDRQLQDTGWIVQDAHELNIALRRAVDAAQIGTRDRTRAIPADHAFEKEKRKHSR